MFRWWKITEWHFTKCEFGRLEFTGWEFAELEFDRVGIYSVGIYQLEIHRGYFSRTVTVLIIVRSSQCGMFLNIAVIIVVINLIYVGLIYILVAIPITV